MRKPTDIGRNRTGTQFSPAEAKKSADGAVDGMREASTDIELLTQLRTEYSSSAEPIGTLPAPTSKTKAKAPAVFIDLLGERLGFERSGVRLYELMLAKLGAADVHEGGPTREELEHFRDEELEHFGLLSRTLEQLGADPTAITPSADMSAVASAGIIQVVSDPRCTLTEALMAIRIAELSDQESWSDLVDLAERLGHTELAEEFQEALSQENIHLRRVRAWAELAVAGQAGIAPTAPTERPGAPA